MVVRQTVSIPVRSGRPASIDQPACQVITCWLSLVSGGRCQVACPGGHYIRPKLAVHGATTKARPTTPPPRGPQNLPSQARETTSDPSKGLNPHQGPVTLSARATSLDGAPTDKEHHTPPDLPWDPGRTMPPMAGPHVQISPAQPPSWLASPNFERGNFCPRSSPLTSPCPNSAAWGLTPPKAVPNQFPI